METKKNIRGELRELGLNKSLTLPKGPYKPSVVRSTAYRVKEDFGKEFTVKVDSDNITVTRLK